MGDNLIVKNLRKREMAANQEEWDSTSDSHTTEVLDILEDEVAEHAEENQSENHICGDCKMLEDIRKAEEEFQHELENLKKSCEKTEKQRQERDAKTSQEETEKQRQKRNTKTSQEETEEQYRHWDELRKERIERFYIGIEVQCKFLRNIDIVATRLWDFKRTQVVERYYLLEI